jgi:hypothetical protein
MTTQEVANQYFELARLNKWDEIQDTFHDEDVICQEPEHVIQGACSLLPKEKKM